MFTRIPRIRNPSSNRNEIVALDIFTVLHDHLAQGGGLHSYFMRARLCTSIAHLLCKLRLLVKTSPYGLAIPDRLQIELREEDANESPLARHLFAIRALLWRCARYTNESLGFSARWTRIASEVSTQVPKEKMTGRQTTYLHTIV
jgi:hypothetical protein